MNIAFSIKTRSPLQNCNFGRRNFRGEVGLARQTKGSICRLEETVLA